MKSLGQLVLLFILSVFFLVVSSEAHTYYVSPIPLPNPGCALSEYCFTLDYYSQNANLLINEQQNVSLLFLNGLHTLSPGNSIIQFFNIHSLTLKGVDTNNKESTSASCIIEAPYINVTRVSLLTLQNCFLFGSSFHISGVSLLNVAQFAFVSSAVFITSNMKEPSESALLSFANSVMYRAALVLHLSNGSHRAAFERCSFLGQNSGIIGYNLPFSPLNESNAIIDIEKCSFSNDSAGITIIFSVGTAALTVSDCSFQRNHRGLSTTVLNGDFQALIENTVFEKLNHNQGLQTYFFAGTNHNEKHLTLRNVSYLHNNVNLYLGTVVLSGPLNLTVEHCTFQKNFGLISTVFLRSLDVTFMKQNYFINNIGSTGGALYMSSSTRLWLDKSAHVTFENNTATKLGGGIFLEEAHHKSILEASFSGDKRAKCFYQFPFNIDQVHRTDLPVLAFLNNSAEMGGDNIYGASLASNCEVTADGSSTSNLVKKQVFEFHSPSLSLVSSIPRRVCLCDNNVPQCENIDYIFWNISATSGEKFTVNLALVGDDFGTVTGVVHASDFSDLKADHSIGIGQKQQQINTNKECSSIEYSIHSKRQEVTIYLSTDSITASSQRAIRGSLSFSKEELAMARDAYHEKGIINYVLLTVPVSITVTVLPCPVGFQLSENDLVCHCEQYFLKYIKSCSVVNRTGLMHRNGSIWLSTESPEGNSSGTVLAHTLCPFGYCRSNCIAISLEEPDAQCDYNRSGILCGGCPPGFSLAIGSSRCIQCSDERHLSLTLAFLSAGIVLVFFIKVLDLTVARGTINGLIFYANILWINQNIFFPSGSDYSGYNTMQLYQFVRVFVAWLNLDLGIETCFFADLNAYWKTWLQFVFPFYLWILAALIIVACHYSTLMTKLFGNNAVAVLATIIMLSYVKLLRTIVTILSFANLQQYNPPGIRSVWLEDGNIPYLSTRHSIIFTAALLVLIILWLPFTALLLLTPCLKRYSNSKITNWVNKFKPFFDSYFGPLKDNRNYWIGLTLSVRVVLAIIAAVVQATNPTVSIDLAVIMTLLLIVPLTNAYREVYNFAFELCFLVNIAITGVAYLSTSDMYSRIVFTCVSGLVSFILFLAIIVFHSYTSLKSLYSFWHKKKSSSDPSQSTDNATGSGLQHNQVAKNYDDPSYFGTRSSIDLRDDILEA